MVDFAAHYTIRAIKIGFQKYYILPVSPSCFRLFVRYSSLEFPHTASSKAQCLHALQEEQNG